MSNVAGAVLSGIGTIGNLALGITDSVLQQKHREKMFDIDERNFDYMAATQNKLWEREDNAIQRRVADLAAAGLSPLRAVEGAAVGSAVGQNNVPNITAPNVSATGLGTAASMLQSGGFDLIKEAFKSKTASEMQDKIDTGKRNLLLLELNHHADQQAARIASEEKMFGIEDERVRQQLADTYAVEMKKANAMIEANDIRNRELATSILTSCVGKNPDTGDWYSFVPVPDDMIGEKMSEWIHGFDRFFDIEASKNLIKTSTGDNTGGNFNLGAAPLGTVGMGAQHGSSSSKDGSSYYWEARRNYQQHHPMPVSYSLYEAVFGKKKDD